MRVTVILEDKSVGVDEEFYFFDRIDADPNYTAIQWYSDYGTIEVKAGDRIWFSDVSVIQPYVDMWTAKKAEVAALQIASQSTITSTQISNGPTVIQ